MKTLIIALLLTATALAADPSPITRPEQILALIPDETRPRGKKEWELVSLEKASEALRKEVVGRPIVLALKAEKPSRIPKGEQFLLHTRTDQFEWRGKPYYLRAQARLPLAAFEQAAKFKTNEAVKISGTITGCTLNRRGGAVEIALELENCELK